MNKTADSMIAEVEKRGNLLLFLGVLTVILGMLCMAATLVTGLAVGMLVGGLLLVGGVVRLIFAFKAESWGSGVFRFITGALSVLCGLIMLGRPLLGLASLTLVLAVYFLVDGIFQMITAFQIKPQQGWGWVLFSGLAAFLLGYLIWSQWPFSGVWAVGILVGINLFMSGWSMIAWGGTAREIASEMQSSGT
jgi:uncharacterized membrane protein HdeD (DUF308 family)